MTGNASAPPGVDWAKVLGSASLALAVAPLASASRVGRMIGLDDRPTSRWLLRAVGAREAAAAAGLLGLPRRWMLWGRVAGDAMDLGLLGVALASGRSDKSVGQLVRTAAASALVAGITAVDAFAAAGRQDVTSGDEVTAAVTVNRPVQECFDAWRDFSRLPEFMLHLDSVTVGEDGLSHWRATAPFGRTVEWDAEIVDETPGQEICWRSRPGADVDNEGSVTFRPSPSGGTEVRVALAYRGVGPAGRAAARLAGENPRQQLDDDLRRYKQVLETGEVVRSDGAPDGKRARREFPQRPAQPAPRDQTKAPANRSAAAVREPVA